MNYAQYMRKVASRQQTILGFQNGQDASLVTYKAQAAASSVKTPNAVPTSFSQIGGTVANIMQESQQTSSPTDAVCESGYSGVSNSQLTTTFDGTNAILASAQHCAVCSDTKEPYAVVLPCCEFIDPVFNAPGKTCCSDPGIKINPTDLLAQEAQRQMNIRKQYNLPNKLQGLRGPIVGTY